MGGKLADAAEIPPSNYGNRWPNRTRTAPVGLVSRRLPRCAGCVCHDDGEIFERNLRRGDDVALHPTRGLQAQVP